MVGAVTPHRRASAAAEIPGFSASQSRAAYCGTVTAAGLQAAFFAARRACSARLR